MTEKKYVPTMTFDEAIDRQVAIGKAVDESRLRSVDGLPDPALIQLFHEASLEVRRIIHREFPDQYGDPG